MPDCQTHSGRSGEEARVSLDAEMMKLPYSQAGEGRHKCPYCAFEEGLKRGRREARIEITQRLNLLVENFMGK